VVSPSDFRKFLKKHDCIGLDSNILIYFIEAHPNYLDLVKIIFNSIDSGRKKGVCSTLSLMEILVEPYRQKNETLVNEFYGLLTTYPHLTWIDLTTEIADLGANLRAKYKIKTPDAILLASAIYSDATGFICNDKGLRKVEEIDVLILDS
jgi:predicted nucleic acid-binding protein